MSTPNTESPILPVRAGDILLASPRFLQAAISITAWTVIILLLNILRIGGNDFVFDVNIFSASAVSALAAGYTAKVWWELKDDPLSNQVWRFLLISFSLWAGLEAVRLLRMLTSQNPALPALTWFGLASYPTFFYGLYKRHQDIRDTPSIEQRRLLWGIGGVGLLFILGAEIFPAIFQAYKADIAASILTSLYTLLDLALLLGTIRIVLTYQTAFAGPWRFFAIGLAAKTAGEIVLFFPGQFGAGNPGMGNFLLSLANFAHYNWYIFAALGMVVYDTIIQHKNAPSSSASAPVMAEEKTPNANALIFTDKDDLVIRTSLNFRYLLRLPDGIATSKLPLRELLGLSETDYDEYKTLLLKQSQVTKFIVKPAYLRQGQKAWLTSVVSYDVRRKYNGADTIVQVLAEGVGGASLTSEERAVAENIFWRAGSQGEDNLQLLIDYFNTNYKMLSSLASEYEGSKRAAGLSETVNQVASRQKISVNVLEQQIMVRTGVKLEELAPVTAILLDTARAYVSKLAGPEIVRQETEQINRQADLSTKKLIERFKLAK
jgi:hypothetical protein